MFNGHHERAYSVLILRQAKKSCFHGSFMILSYFFYVVDLAVSRLNYDWGGHEKNKV